MSLVCIPFPWPPYGNPRRSIFTRQDTFGSKMLSNCLWDRFHKVIYNWEFIELPCVISIIRCLHFLNSSGNSRQKVTGVLERVNHISSIENQIRYTLIEFSCVHVLTVRVCLRCSVPKNPFQLYIILNALFEYYLGQKSIKSSL